METTVQTELGRAAAPGGALGPSTPHLISPFFLPPPPPLQLFLGFLPVIPNMMLDADNPM